MDKRDYQKAHDEWDGGVVRSAPNLSKQESLEERNEYSDLSDSELDEEYQRLLSGEVDPTISTLDRQANGMMLDELLAEKGRRLQKHVMRAAGCVLGNKVEIHCEVIGSDLIFTVIGGDTTQQISIKNTHDGDLSLIVQTLRSLLSLSN